MDICTAQDFGFIIYLMAMGDLSKGGYDAIELIQGFKEDRLYVERDPEMPTKLLSFKLLDKNGMEVCKWK